MMKPSVIKTPLTATGAQPRYSNYNFSFHLYSHSHSNFQRIMANKTMVYIAMFLLVQVLFLVLEYTAMYDSTMSMFITLHIMFIILTYSILKLIYSRHHTATLDDPNENTPLLPLVLPPPIQEVVIAISP